MAVDKPAFSSLSVSLGRASSDQLRLEFEEATNTSTTTEYRGIYSSTSDDSSSSSSVSTKACYDLTVEKGSLDPWGGGLRTTKHTKLTVGVSASKGSAGALYGDGSQYGRWVMMFPPDSGAELFVSRGTAKVINKSVALEIEDEEVQFVGTNEATLKYSADENFSYWWAGTPVFGEEVHNPKPAPSVYEDKLTLPSICECGMMKVSYTTYFDRVEVKYGGSDGLCGNGDILLVAKRMDPDDPENPEYASLTIEFGDSDDDDDDPDEDEDEDEEKGYKDIVFSVVNFCDDLMVDGVVVTIIGPTGTHQGVTNADGECLFSHLLVGGEYSVKMTKKNYTDSDLDALNNDSFTVPEDVT